MRTLELIICGLACLLFVPNTEGSGCARYSSYSVSAPSYSYAAPAAYVAPVAVYVPLYVPTYNVTYDPTGGAQGLALLERLQAIESKLNSLDRADPPTFAPPSREVLPTPSKAPRMPPAAKAPTPAKGFALFQQKCASCHDGKKDGNPVLFSKGAVINERGIPEKIMQSLRTGVMGKQKLPPLSDSQRLEMTYHLFDLPPVETAKGK